MHPRIVWAALLLAATGTSQVTIPPHGSVYNGYSRGFNFTAATNFIITQLDLPLDAYLPGDSAGYLVRKNGTVALHSVGNAGALATSILVNTGDVVDVIGNWSPAAPGSFTAHNSYAASAAPYATTIEGVPHTLMRTGWQYDIGVAPLTGTYLAPVAGQMGRVFMFTAPQNGLFANFSATPVSGNSPLQVQFTDGSYSSDPGGVQSWAWDFENDGFVDSAARNPTHTYACGTWSVRLVVTDLTHPASQVVRSNLITVDALTASFTVAFLVSPGIFQFTDTSTANPTTWAWDFDNDGIVDSTAQNPVYPAPSPCHPTTVRLTVANGCQAASTTRVLTLVDPTLVSTFAGAVAGGTGTSSATWLGGHFDVVVTAGEGINVCSVQVTPYSFAGPFDVQVHVTDNTFVGKDANSAAWRLVALGSGVANGGSLTNPTLVDVALNTPFYLPPGNHGLAIYIDNPAGTANLAYSTAPAASPYVGADLTIHPAGVGIVKTGLFAGGTLTPRLWNGGFRYTKCSTSQTPGFGFYGPGCAGLLGIPGQDAQNAPRIGTAFLVDVTNVPGGAGGIAFMTMGLSRTTSAFGPLPFHGAAFGAPGCYLRASSDGAVLLLGGPTATWSIAIPAASNLLCQQFWTQALVASPGSNALGWVASDAYGIIIGQ